MIKYIVILLVTLCCMSCSMTRHHDEQQTVEMSSGLKALLFDTLSRQWDMPLDSAYDSGCVRLRSRRLPLGPSRTFNDSNRVHLEVARAAGIGIITAPEAAWINGRGLVKVLSDSNIYIDKLTHSYPYLTPLAAELLLETGKRFSDSLDARGGGEYRIKVTSMLRTPQSVGRLKRVNRNANAESAHTYGTTFDISYSKFICDDARATRRTFDDLRELLIEIVDDLRNEGRCKVKIERRQACLHITAIPRDTVYISE